MAKMRPMLTSIVLLLACRMHLMQEEDQRPVVNMPDGAKVYGLLMQAENGAQVNAFLGIPYAESPTGYFRFQHAYIKAHIKNTTIEADKLPPACPQYSEQPLPWYDLDPGQSEDCLYLNIWAPSNIGEKKRPVKLYIHGGGWFDGGSSRMPYYDGFGEAVDTMYENGTSKEDGVVVVTANYRLGALGFLSSYDHGDDADGNAGLTDVKEVFYWTLTSIRFFGGSDGTNKNGSGDIPITLVGEGSGAMMVSLLRLMIQNEFRMVLNGATLLTLQSLEGVDTLGDAYFNNLRLTDLLAKKLGCGSLNNSGSAIDCLREVEVTRLMRVAASLSRGRGPPNVFLPQFNGASLFQANPNMLLHLAPKFSIFDTLATFTSDDGSALLTSAFPKLFGVFGEKDVPLSAACATKATRRFLNKFPVTVADEMLGDMDQEPTFANREKVVQALGDAYFNCPMVFYAEELKRIKEGEKNTVQVHLLEKKVYPPYNPFASWMGSVGFDNVQIDFVHPDGLTVNNQTYQYTDEQNEQVRKNQDLLKSFMKKQELPFPKFTPEDPAYGVLDSDGKLSEERNFRSQSCDILRPYFKYQKDMYYGYGYIIKE